MTTKNPTLISLSESATDKLKKILEEQGTPDGFLRITLAPGGHGGAQYILGLEEEAGEDDTIIDGGGVKVLVDADSAPLMEGASIDYKDDMDQSGFIIANPNFSGGGGGGGCGCGGGGCGCGAR